MCLAQGPQRSDAGKARTISVKHSTTEPLRFHLNSSSSIFKIRILAQFVISDFTNNTLLHTKRFYFKRQTHIEHSSAKMNIQTARDSLLLAKMSKITPPSDAYSCE